MDGFKDIYLVEVYGWGDEFLLKRNRRLVQGRFSFDPVVFHCGRDDEGRAFGHRENLPIAQV
jgi:hypothetical protein